MVPHCVVRAGEVIASSVGEWPRRRAFLALHGVSSFRQSGVLLGFPLHSDVMATGTVWTTNFGSVRAISQNTYRGPFNVNGAGGLQSGGLQCLATNFGSVRALSHPKKNYRGPFNVNVV